MLKHASACIAATALSLLAGGSAHSEGFADRSELETVSGTFRSSAPERWYGGYGVREFVFHDGQWSLIFKHALDPEMTMRTFQFRTGGGYEILEQSADVPGAHHGVFYEEWKHVTLLTETPEVIAAMGMSECGLTPNLETDISETGCASWRPVAECDEDHDLFALDETGVYFGVRPQDNNLCTADRLPTALLPVAPRF